MKGAGAVAFIALVASTVHSATIRVPEDYPNVLAAVDAAAAGDSVLVGPGVWTEKETRLDDDGQHHNACAFIEQPITLIGSAGAEATILDGGGAGEVVFQGVFVGAVIQDLTITGSNTERYALNARNSSIVLLGCRFVNNGYTIRAGPAYLRDCEFTANDRGPSVSIADVAHCRFSDNAGSTLSASSGVVRDCLFLDNAGSVRITSNGELRGNTMSHGMGPAFVAGLIEGNTFSSMTGTVILAAGIHTDVRNNTFFDIEGSALRVAPSEDLPTFATFDHNVVVSVRSAPAISWTEAGPYDEPVEFTESCNVFWDNDQDSVGPLDPSDHHVDPRFCDPEALDFGVPEGSFCTEEGNPFCGAIGAGDPTCPATHYTLVTFPSEFSILVDGTEVPSGSQFAWPPGTTHEIGVAEDFEGDDGRGYLFESWSDGGSATHSLVASASPATLIAQIGLKYRLDVTNDGHGTTTPETSWHAESSYVEIDATPFPPYQFWQWEGEGPGSYSGPVANLIVPMFGPISQFGTFHRLYTLTMIAQPGGWVTPESGEHFTGEQIQIRAFPDIYHSFGGWVGEGPGSFTGGGRNRTITMGEGDITQTAHFVSNVTYPVTVNADEGGSATPASGDYPASEPLELVAIPDPGYQFLGWSGTGDGSYTGIDSVATAIPTGPIVQRAVFGPVGFSYRFSISASDTDPYVLTDGPTGSPRNLYFWAHCMLNGLAAFEADAAGTLAPLGFVPAPNVYNLATDGDLLLVIAGCPLEGPLLLGHWPVIDTGGTFCLEPSAEDGFFGPLDCSGYTPFLYQNAGILGFSSSGETPCELGTGSCTQQPTALFFSQFRAQPAERTVEVTWYAPGSTRATDFAVHRGNAIGDGLVPLRGEIVPIEGGFRLVDADVVANETYAYRLFALGREWSATTLVTTPNWAPRVTGFARLGPNPFRRATDIVFSTKEPAHARLAVYDVQGRLVSTLVNADLPFGEHLATWDGRTERGFAPGGVYFVKLEVGTVTQTRKIVYLAGPR